MDGGKFLDSWRENFCFRGNFLNREIIEKIEGKKLRKCKVSKRQREKERERKREKERATTGKKKKHGVR